VLQKQFQSAHTILYQIGASGHKEASHGYSRRLPLLHPTTVMEGIEILENHSVLLPPARR
jgi:hypothetical protein